MSRVPGLSPRTDSLFYGGSVRTIIAADGVLGLFQGWEVVVLARAMDERGIPLIKYSINRFIPASGVVAALDGLDLRAELENGWGE
jgi:hypothetical protein